MYFNNGESSSAEKIFSSISKKDVVLWTEMIAGHSRLTDGESAVKFFRGMPQEGHKIDSFALSSAVSARADLAAMKQGEIIHSVAIKTGHDVEMTVDAPDLKCWNSMLGGYGHHGKAEAAFRVFDEILKLGLKPDLITFISMLAACSHCGLVEKGKFLWTCMKENGLTPGPKHISCMISLLSRAGLLEEAEEMILELPSNDSYLGLWRTLLSSCVSNRNLPIGVRAAERILSRDEEDCAANTLITNVYAATGRWDDVAKMRKKGRGLTPEKDPGLSWIEDMNTTHVFSSGDQSHPEVNSVQAELHRLQGNLTIAQLFIGHL
ncbi:hypothetical protein RJ639_024594 [Escallonia herrerae]|uniref:Pentatricopeptide repeat-containing protein n=1 Tax=Escallonia herrerae TaxID=1293975 RepID=A0AA88UZL8_9ASTE|nr:hypothetical protein RJ639_024594 [Escallonia herrerae]